MDNFAAITASTIFVGLIIFQVLLIIGRPYGRFAWGGQHEVLPNTYRIGSLISIIIYLISIYILLSTSGVIDSVINDSTLRILSWALVFFFGLGIPMNALSRSRPERLVMTPIVTVLTILCVIVAINASSMVTDSSETTQESGERIKTLATDGSTSTVRGKILFYSICPPTDSGTPAGCTVRVALVDQDISYIDSSTSRVLLMNDNGFVECEEELIRDRTCSGFVETNTYTLKGRLERPSDPQIVSILYLE